MKRIGLFFLYIFLIYSEETAAAECPNANEHGMKKEMKI